MNTSVELAYISVRTAVSTFSELDTVRLLRAVADRDGQVIDRGSQGAIVAVYGDGEAYEVEFVEPLQALATVGAEDIELSR